MDSEELKTQLREYESHIRQVISVFVDSFGQANPGPLWRQGKIDRVGFAGPNNEVGYSVHGFGCTAELNNRHISFDFDPEGNYVYSPFKFMLFLPEDSVEHEELRTLFMEMLSEGELVSVPGRGVRLRQDDVEEP